MTEDCCTTPEIESLKKRTGPAVDNRLNKIRRRLQPAPLSLAAAFFIIIFGLSTTIFIASGTEGSMGFDSLPVKGKVTLIDLGSNSCIPCKMMAPILEKIKERYQGKAEVIVIDIYKYRDQAPRFKIRAIPTQIFFNEKGDEVFRHLGFMSEKDIVSKMRELGVN